LIVSGLHAPIAVVSTPPESKARARAALEHQPGVAVVDAAALVGRFSEDRERLKALRAERVARDEGKVRQLRQTRHQAGEALAQAHAAVESALGSLDEFDRAEKSLALALERRDEATAAEAVEARRLAAVLERRERLMRQRDDAMRAIQKLEAEGPVRRSAEMRRQVAQLEVGLARAEAEQTRAELAAETALQQARAARLTAAAELNRADQAVRADLPGFPGLPADDWPPGPPLPVLLAERRDRLAAGLGERYAAISAARGALDAASEALRAAELNTAESRRSVLALVVSSAVESLLEAGSGRTAGRIDIVLCDEPFAGMDVSVVAAVLERVVRAGTIQVIYLTSDPEIRTWAEKIPSDLGGLSTITASEGPAAPAADGALPWPSGLRVADRPAS
jgi:hypothetical protein